MNVQNTCAACTKNASPCLPSAHAPNLPHLCQGHGGGGGRAQPMCHRHRQEAFLAVLAAGVHGGEPGAHGACGVSGQQMRWICTHARMLSICTLQLTANCVLPEAPWTNLDLLPPPAPTCIVLQVVNGGGLPQNEALGRQQAPHVAAAGGDVCDDELQQVCIARATFRVTIPHTERPGATPYKCCSAAREWTIQGPAQRLAWMPMRCSLLCRVTKERAAVASRPCTRLQRSRGQGKQAGMLRLRIRCPH